MILAEQKIAFIHVPKTAGTSITRALGGERDHSTLRHYLPFRPKFICDHSNYTYADVRLLANILRSKFLDRQASTCIDQDWRVFTVVRNPWSRCLSWWFDVQRHEPHRQKLKIDKNIGLYDFIKKYHGRSMGLIPQTYWLKDWCGGMGAFDLIVKQELLDEDWSRVQKLLNVSASLPRVNATPKAYKCDDFYSADTIRLVSLLYQDEIDLFGYEYSPYS